MTFNIGNGLARPDRLGTHLAGLDVDVIGMQEVSGGQEQSILRGTEASHPHRVISGAGFHGRGLISRFPILRHEWLELSPGRPDLLATLDIDGTTLTVLVGHPMPPRVRKSGVVFDPIATAQIERFGEVVSNASPGILLADLNMTVRNPLHALLLERGLVDAHLSAGTGHGRTFPLHPGHTRRINHPFTGLPLRAFTRIDYIWHTPDLTTEAVWLEAPVGSDHRPVVARLTLPILHQP
jgi:endonuclease/exonuclease/phosphatase (EEP) superfamily protein YafD